MTINVGLLISYVVSLLIMIVFPIVLAFIANTRLKVSWWVILTGVITFVVSQALRIPASYGLTALFNNGTLPTPSDAWIPILNALIAGLLAGFFEETCRYIGFRVLKKNAKPFTSALGLGVGHGGIEAIVLGALGTATTLFTVLFYNPGAQIAKGVSTSEVSYMLSQISSFWTASWHTGLLPGVERIIALSTQIVLSILVWKAVKNRQALWYVLAVVYHTAVDAIAVYLQQLGWGYWKIEGLLAIFLIANVYLIYYFWKEESDKSDEEDEDEEDDEEGEDEDDIVDAEAVDSEETEKTLDEGSEVESANKTTDEQESQPDEK